MTACHLSVAASFQRGLRQGFYDQHKAVARVMYIILPGLALGGAFLYGAVGGVWGLTVFFLTYYLTPYAWVTLHGPHV